MLFIAERCQQRRRRDGKESTVLYVLRYQVLVPVQVHFRREAIKEISKFIARRQCKRRSCLG
jgi:hypothetical protein